MELKAAICPNCGGDLRLPEDKKVLKCMYCGKDIIVSEAIEKAVGPAVENYLVIAKTALNARNYKEAYDYYNKILELNPMNHEAWLGKAESVGWQSTFAESKIPEMMANFENALRCCPAQIKNDFKVKSVLRIENVLIACFNSDTYYTRQWGTGNQICSNSAQLADALESLHKLLPANKQILDGVIEVLKRQVAFANESYRSTLNLKLNQYVAKRQALNPKYVPPPSKPKRFNLF